MVKRLPLPVKRSLRLTEAAHARLRHLNQIYGLGNNYLLVVLLENLDEIADPNRLEAAFQNFIAEYGAPDAIAKE